MLRESDVAALERPDELETPRGRSEKAPNFDAPNVEAPNEEAPAAKPADKTAREPAGETAPPAGKRKRSRRLPLLLAGLGALSLVGWYGYDWWTVGRFQVSTDDAYVGADFAVISPKISGYVDAVPASENAHVDAGAPLVALEDGDYRNALEAAQSQLASQQAALTRLDRQIEAAKAAVAQAQARKDAALASQAQADADFHRFDRLAKSNFASGQQLEAARAAKDTADANVADARAGVVSAQAAVAVAQAQRTEAQAALTGLEAARQRAERDLAATVIRAPFGGVVGNLSVAAGDYVTPGKRLLAVVPLGAVYVEANFKETQIGELTAGTPVTVHVDAFPDRDFTGHVDSLSPASGSVFSLLPPENATGNFTKVVQRVPVRVAVPQDVADAGWLRPGMSVTATADTRAAQTNAADASAAQ